MHFGQSLLSKWRFLAKIWALFYSKHPVTLTKKLALPVNLDIEEDEEAEGDDAKKDQPAPAVVGRVDRVHPQLRQTDQRMSRQIR